MTSYADVSAECKRAVVGREILPDPDASNRTIARRLGVGHTLVNRIRLEIDDGEKPDMALARAADEVVSGKVSAATRWQPERTWLEADEQVVAVRDDLIRRVKRLERENRKLRKLVEA
jgi:hypothetical protein